MTFVTSDQIRDMSIKTVEGFLNGKVPLSAGLAKHASYHNLNSDQIQRAVEATNSIAYLKVLSLADDRTMEFPLCKYAEVMQGIALPETMLKTASNVDKILSSDAKYLANPIEKTAAAIEKITDFELSDAEKQVYFIKMAAQNQRELSDLKDREMFLGPELMKAASDLRKDPQALEKIATVLEGKEFSKLTTLVYGTPQGVPDQGLFKSAELQEVKSLVGLLKQAEDLLIEIKSKEDLAKRSELVKEAFLGAIGAGIGRAVGATLAAPVKLMGRAVGRTASNLHNSTSNAGISAANKVRSSFGAAPKPLRPFTPKRFGVGAGLAVAGSVAGDAVMYSPGKDRTTGRSKDVWTSLQREPNN